MPRRAPADGSLPLAASEFTALMRPFMPFEHRPVLAVAVSGGRDSRALALLARQWARRRGGRVVALVVDHGLRAEAAAEAERTSAWLATEAIEAHVLSWRPSQPPRSGVQAAARVARYRLLLDWCLDHGVLHLLTAHQADDQAETCMLRAARDSGPAGLAGMAALLEYPQARLLRPLLPVPRSRLTATLAAGGHDWIDDPSNADPRFARARLRQQMPAPDSGEAARRSAQLALRRIAEEGAVAAALAACAMPHPLGAVFLDHTAWRDLPAPTARLVLAAIVATVAGSHYPPRRERTERAALQMRTVPCDAPLPPAGLTLGGCRILWRGAGWLIAREPASIAANGRGAVAPADGDGRWDGRFDIRKQDGAGAALPGPAPASSVGRRHRWALAWPATPGLPAILAGLPPGASSGPVVGDGSVAPAAEVRFRPVKPLAPGPFFPCFASPEGQIVNDSHIARRRISPGASTGRMP